MRTQYRIEKTEELIVTLMDFVDLLKKIDDTEIDDIDKYAIIDIGVLSDTLASKIEGLDIEDLDLN